ncbi:MULTISPECIES: hypothetical protein [unclassified Psychrobacter]|uniref:hypothetical protein n=1 Tax=unclassified Psychrobacter TaxID=196806 RepID=UPI0025B3180A|nr:MULTISPECIES: hypothetical protein [unclassified Psychrobacter]MDN3453232.1 hypothetical protein [Psychrobacter sp. APC 3350]MDN3502315.1 hypothetical protein [Psychrobacter sp. 5A.1]
MSSVLNNDDLIAKDINNENLDNSLQRTDVYQLLKEREQCWWQARQQLIERQEKKMFWYGENSLIMWLLWQLVGYVLVAMALMLLNNVFSISLPLWQYISLFIIQTICFVSALAAKGQLANKLQCKIDNDELMREEALNEMVVLAEDSLYPDVHAKSPISLEQLDDYLNGQFHLASLQCLLQKEVNAGRLIMEHQPLEVGVLPPDLADDELNEHASEIMYKSTL